MRTARHTHQLFHMVTPHVRACNLGQHHWWRCLPHVRGRPAVIRFQAGKATTTCPLVFIRNHARTPHQSQTDAARQRGEKPKRHSTFGVHRKHQKIILCICSPSSTPTATELVREWWGEELCFLVSPIRARLHRNQSQDDSHHHHYCHSLHPLGPSLTSRPLPLPYAAPSMIPGKSSSWIRVSL